MDKKILLEALITEREGMFAENAQRAYRGDAPAYTDEDFEALADKMRMLGGEQSDGAKEIQYSPKVDAIIYSVLTADFTAVDWEDLAEAARDQADAAKQHINKEVDNG